MVALFPGKNLTSADFLPPISNSAGMEIEASILGTVLVNPRAIKTLIKLGLPVEAFEFTPHQHLYHIMSQLWLEENRLPDLKTVTLTLTELGILADIGGRAFLATLVSCAGLPIWLKQHTELLIKTYKQRQLASIAHLPLEEAKEKIEELASDSPKKTLLQRIKEVIKNHPELSLRNAHLMELATEYRRHYKDVERLAKLLQVEEDLKADIASATDELKKLNRTRRDHLNPYDYFEANLASRLQATADAMPTCVEWLMTTLWATAATCIGTSSRIVIKASAGYIEPAVIWSAIVGDTGELKTPAQKAIIKPLLTLEAEAAKVYQIALRQYEQELEAYRLDPQNKPLLTKPTRKRFLTKDTTLETLQRLHGNNPRGLLVFRDELAGGAKARNQYRGGKGADAEAELDQFNGSALIYDRSDVNVFLEQTCISRTGGYQWETAEAIMDAKSDFNGMNARWLLDAAQPPKPYIDLLSPESDVDTGLSELLYYLYKHLHLLPQQDYLLSQEAKAMFQAYQHCSVDEACAEENPALRAVYAKNRTYVARLALVLHCMNAVLRGELPATTIDGGTMTCAIDLANYYLWQYRHIHKHNDSGSGLEGAALKLQRYAAKVGEGIKLTASAIKRNVRALRTTANDTIRGIFQSLVAAGFGRVEGEGESMVYISSVDSVVDKASTAPIKEKSNSVCSVDTVDTVDAVVDSVSTAQTLEKPSSVCSVDKVDTVDEAAIEQAEMELTQKAQEGECQLVNSVAETLETATVDTVDTAVNCDVNLDAVSTQSQPCSLGAIAFG